MVRLRSRGKGSCIGSCYTKRALAQPVAFLYLLMRCALDWCFDYVEITKLETGEENILTVYG